MHILFLVTALIFSLGELGRIVIGESISFRMSDIAIFLLMLWEFFRSHSQLKQSSRIALAIFLFAITAGSSLVLNASHLSNTEFFTAFLYLVRWMLYAGIFFAAQHVSYKMPKYLLVSGLLLTLFGFLQYFLYPDLRNMYYLGWDDHLYRLFSTLLDPNFTATILCLTLFLLLGSLRIKQSQKKSYVSELFLLVFVFTALLLTYSRSGFVMFATGSITFLWLDRKKEYIAFLLVVLTVGIILLPKNLGSAGVELWRTASINARIEAANQAVTIFTNYPFFGVGFNTYRYALRDFGFADGSNWQESHSGGGTDNSFLFILATTGIIGASSFIYLSYTIIRRTLIVLSQHKNQSERYYSIVILASLAGIAVNAFFINSLFYPYVLFWFWSLLGMQETITEKT